MSFSNFSGWHIRIAGVANFRTHEKILCSHVLKIIIILLRALNYRHLDRILCYLLKYGHINFLGGDEIILLYKLKLI